MSFVWLPTCTNLSVVTTAQAGASAGGRRLSEFSQGNFLAASGEKAVAMRELAKQDNTKIDVWVNHTEYVKIQIYSRANITITKPKDYK